MNADPCLAPDGDVFVPDWILPLWPKLRPIAAQAINLQPDEHRAALLAAISAGPGAVLVRERDGYVYLGAGRPLRWLCAAPLEDLLPDVDKTH